MWRIKVKGICLAARRLGAFLRRFNLRAHGRKRYDSTLKVKECRWLVLFVYEELTEGEAECVDFYG